MTATLDEIEARLKEVEDAILEHQQVLHTIPKAPVTLLRVFSLISVVLGITALIMGYLPSTYGVAFTAAAPLLLGFEKILDTYLTDNGVTPPVHPAPVKASEAKAAIKKFSVEELDQAVALAEADQQRVLNELAEKRRLALNGVTELGPNGKIPPPPTPPDYQGSHS